MKIHTTKRGENDWIAWIEKTATWECGETEVEALGKLMITIIISGNFEVIVKCMGQENW